MKAIRLVVTHDVPANYFGGNALPMGSEVVLEASGAANNGAGPQRVFVRPKAQGRDYAFGYFVGADDLQPAPSVLVEIRRGEAFHVYLKSNPDVCATGKSRTEALGTLLLKYGEELNVRLEVG